MSPPSVVTNPPTASPVIVPTSSLAVQVHYAPSTSSSSTSVESPGDGSSSSLGMPAIIGIAVGGGLGLILLVGAICYVAKKRNSEDGVDT